MYTSFASQNSPAIQVWDFFNTFASSSSPRVIHLADDCAPIQLFKTGGSASTTINVYLPSSSIEGRRIKIINTRYGGSEQKINVRSSDVSGSGSNLNICAIGQGQALDFIYTKFASSFGPSGGIYQSGWITLNQAGSTAANYGAICLGDSNASTASYSVVVGGNSNIASNANASILGGFVNTSSSTYSTVVGGAFNLSNASSSAVIGGTYGTTRGIRGNLVSSASENPISGSAGFSQTGLLILGRETTNATTTTLASSSSAAGTTNQVILPNNSAYYFRGTVIANVTAAGNTKAWTFDGAIKRGANAASTALVGSPVVTSTYADAGAAAWTIALSADTTNGGLKVDVTGAAATTIRWVCRIETTEVTF